MYRFSETMNRTFLIVLLLGLWMGNGFNGSAQAFCALRDPNAIIRELFPESTRFKSITATIGQEQVAELEKATGIKCDPREFGRHRLYVVFKNGQIEGYVQSRSELVDWGIAEIIIGTDPNGTLKGFRFQRCRSRQRKAVEAASMQALLAGLQETDLLQYVDREGLEKLQKKAGLPNTAKPLLRGVVLGAIKMQTLMRTVWHDEISALEEPK